MKWMFSRVEPWLALLPGLVCSLEGCRVYTPHSYCLPCTRLSWLWLQVSVLISCHWSDVGARFFHSFLCKGIHYIPNSKGRGTYCLFMLGPKVLSTGMFYFNSVVWLGIKRTPLKLGILIPWKSFDSFQWEELEFWTGPIFNRLLIILISAFSYGMDAFKS